jgi:hypothetical protein
VGLAHAKLPAMGGFQIVRREGRSKLAVVGGVFLTEKYHWDWLACAAREKCVLCEKCHLWRRRGDVCMRAVQCSAIGCTMFAVTEDNYVMQGGEE